MVTPQGSNAHRRLDPGEPARLAALQRYAILDSPPEAEYDELAQLAASICNTPIAAISLLDDTRQWFKSRVGLETKQTPRDISFCDHAIRKPAMFEVADAGADPRFRNNPLVTGEPRIRFYAGVPLITPDGHALGTLCVIDRQCRHLDEQQRKALNVLARQVMQQLELRRALMLSEREIASRLEAEAKLQKLNETLEEQVRDRSRILQATLDRLRDAEVQLHSLFENAAVGLAAIDSATRLQRCNPAFEEIVGVDAKRFLGQSIAELVSAKDAAELTQGLMDALDAQSTDWMSEVRLRSASQESRWVRFGIVPVRGGKNPDMRGIVFAQNVSPGKLAQLERDRFFELSADMFVIAGHDGRIYRLNPSCRRILGLKSGEQLGARLIDLVDSSDQAKAQRILEGLTRDEIPESLYLDLKMRDAKQRWRIIRWSAVNWREGNRIIAAGRDVTEVIEAEESLHALAARLQSIREEERTRISREIHDDLGQRLTALKMDLDMLGRDLASGRSEAQAKALRDEMRSTLGLVDATMDAVRRIAQDLRPDVLDALGLAPALEWLAQDLRRRTGLEVELQSPPQLPKLSDEQTTAIFRIVQESLTNVIRHAKADLARIRIEIDDEALLINVEDNGQGLDDARATDTGLSLGLLGMRERASSIGARLTLSGADGRGTRVELEMALDRAQESP